MQSYADEPPRLSSTARTNSPPPDRPDAYPLPVYPNPAHTPPRPTQEYADGPEVVSSDQPYADRYRSSMNSGVPTGQTPIEISLNPYSRVQSPSYDLEAMREYTVGPPYGNFGQAAPAQGAGEPTRPSVPNNANGGEPTKPPAQNESSGNQYNSPSAQNSRAGVERDDYSGLEYNGPPEQNGNAGRDQPQINRYSTNSNGSSPPYGENYNVQSTGFTPIYNNPNEGSPPVRYSTISRPHSPDTPAYNMPTPYPPPISRPISPVTPVYPTNYPPPQNAQRSPGSPVYPPASPGSPPPKSPNSPVYGNHPVSPGGPGCVNPPVSPDSSVYGTAPTGPSSPVPGTSPTGPGSPIFNTPPTGPGSPVYGTAPTNPGSPMYGNPPAVSPGSPLYGNPPASLIYGNPDNYPTEIPNSPPPQYEDLADPNDMGEEIPADQPQLGTNAPAPKMEGYIPKTHTRSSTGKVICHDPVLNKDVNALNQWIEQQAALSPMPCITVTGTHQIVTTTVHSDGRKSTSTQTITDFTVTFDISHMLLPGTLRAADPDEMCHRGTKTRHPATDLEAGPLSVRDWCEVYVNDPGRWKEFSLHRIIVGMNQEILRQNMFQTVMSTNYHGTIDVKFPVYYASVQLSPDDFISHMRYSWARWLFYITFLWIITWPIVWFGTKRWDVVNSYFPVVEGSEAEWGDRWGWIIARIVKQRGRKGALNVANLRWIEANEMASIEERDARRRAQSGPRRFIGGFIRALTGGNAVDSCAPWGMDEYKVNVYTSTY